MPAKSKKQQRYIFFLRNKYKTKDKTPKKFKWIWDKEWEHIEESYNNNNLFNDYLLRVFDKMYNETHDITFPFDITNIPTNDLLDKLFMVVENEDEIQFKRIWNQLPPNLKLKFIKNFHGKFTHDTFDKMYFMLQALI